MEVMNRYVTIKTQINGDPKESDFEIKCSSIVVSAQPGSNDVVIDAYGVAKVVASGNPEFEKDDLVVGMINWGEYSVLKGETYMLRKLDTMGFPLSHHVGIFAFSGLTAYAGLFEVGKPKKGEKVFVSAAAGSIGHLVELLKEKLGFDDAFNYKDESDLKSTLKKYFPNGIDIYFDNVGAEMLEAAVANMNTFGRIAACGVISEYTDTNKRAAPNMLDIVYKRIVIRGFLAADFLNIYPDFLSATVDHIRTGVFKTLEDISIGLESIPQAFLGLFHGSNVGKKMVKLSDD
ncbi:hypothetical protein F8388_004291 [Cannabis sativa]|uniref:Alcohol dehydrogenase-like C-terminal domain-containing protein n=1 Tax=Cannabis sativa TaxID=3483 RepID=A0A7J6H9N1_CANSA|nr:hypothetical protein F8388_004291 [Cannabis sativa]